ncbi:MAG: NRDE family protein [Burkholderiaceae bacterium]|nr:NRDE family protein [Burkholderiaceae bacterium]
MCLIAFALDAHESFAFVVAANRDEYYARETAPAAWWDEKHTVFGGRDLRAGGTWLAIDRRGRFAAVTNVREPDPVSGPRSRGALVAGFVEGSEPARDYAERVLGQADEYAGFNLLLVDLAAEDPALFVSNRDARRIVAPGGGVHAWSNGTLDAPWPKVLRLREQLGHAVHAAPRQLGPTLFNALADRSIPDDRLLPDTGVGAVRERVLAPAMIFAPDLGYGTRASTIVAVRRDGRAVFVERSWAPAGDVPRHAGERRVRFRLAPATVEALGRRARTD